MNTPHHWTNGPADVDPLNQARTRWQFRWWLEPGPGVTALGEDNIAHYVDVVLNKVQSSWGARVGVAFVQVPRRDLAHIVLRFSDAIPPGATFWAGGWYFHDTQIDANIAQISPSVFNDIMMFAYLVGMEMVGHGCFRMHDMYTDNHGPYRGAMGNWHPADPWTAFPSDEEVESAKLWLHGAAVHVHRED